MAMAGALALVGLAAVPAHAAYSTAPRQTWTANGTVFAIAVQGNRVYIGGRFTSVTNRATGQTVARTRLAAFDATTGALVTDFTASANDEVHAIAVSADGSRVFVGGLFTTVDGQARSRVAALTTSGALAGGWNVTASGDVKDLLVVGGDLFLAGIFGTVNGQGRAGLAKVSVATGAVSGWKVPTSGGRPRSIALSSDGTALVIGGWFTALEGQPRTYLGAATVATGDVTGWNPQPACDECDLYDVITDGDAVYGAVGGPGGRASRWSATTGHLLWSTRGDGNCQALALAGGILYVGGHFGPTFGGHTRHQLAAVDPSNGRLLDWDPQLGGADHPGVWALAAGPSYLRVGGGFRTVAGLAQARYAEFPIR